MMAAKLTESDRRLATRALRVTGVHLQMATALIGGAPKLGKAADNLLIGVVRLLAEVEHGAA